MTNPNFADKTVWTGDNFDILRVMNIEIIGAVRWATMKF